MLFTHATLSFLLHFFRTFNHVTRPLDDSRNVLMFYRLSFLTCRSPKRFSGAWSKVSMVPVKATGNSRSEIPGNSRESRTPKIPGGNSREFLKFWQELRGIYGSFVFFPIFIVDYDILVFNLTHCIMSLYVHDAHRLTAFWAKPWMTSLTQLFVFIEFRHTFKYWYRKITEQRQNFANSDRYTNEDAEIFRPRFCIHRPGMF